MTNWQDTATTDAYELAGIPRRERDLMIRRIQNAKPEKPRQFSTVERKRDAACTECGATFRHTKRTYCPKCDTFTVEEITK